MSGEVQPTAPAREIPFTPTPPSAGPEQFPLPPLPPGTYGPPMQGQPYGPPSAAPYGPAYPPYGSQPYGPTAPLPPTMTQPPTELTPPPEPSRWDFAVLLGGGVAGDFGDSNKILAGLHTQLRAGVCLYGCKPVSFLDSPTRLFKSNRTLGLIFAAGNQVPVDILDSRADLGLNVMLGVKLFPVTLMGGVGSDVTGRHAGDVVGNVRAEWAPSDKSRWSVFVQWDMIRKLKYDSGSPDTATSNLVDGHRVLLGTQYLFRLAGN